MKINFTEFHCLFWSLLVKYVNVLKTLCTIIAHQKLIKVVVDHLIGWHEASAERRGGE